jgi:hypothetical protein
MLPEVITHKIIFYTVASVRISLHRALYSLLSAFSFVPVIILRTKHIMEEATARMTQPILDDSVAHDWKLHLGIYPVCRIEHRAICPF